MIELRLYLSNIPSKSDSHINELKEILKSEFNNQFSLKIINVLTNTKLVNQDKIIATPTLVKINPPPVKKIIGDYCNHNNVLFLTGLLRNTDDDTTAVKL